MYGWLFIYFAQLLSFQFSFLPSSVHIVISVPTYPPLILLSQHLFPFTFSRTNEKVFFTHTLGSTTELPLCNYWSSFYIFCSFSRNLVLLDKIDINDRIGCIEANLLHFISCALSQYTQKLQFPEFKSILRNLGVSYYCQVCCLLAGPWTYGRYVFLPYLPLINCLFHLFRSSARSFSSQCLLLFLKSSRSFVLLLLLPTPFTSVLSFNGIMKEAISSQNMTNLIDFST